MQTAYETGLTLVSRMEAAEGPEEELPTLQELGALVQDVESSAQSLQQAVWPPETELQREPWSKLVAMRDHAAELAHHLISRVDSALEVRRTKLAQLSPHLDREVARNKMRAAYGADSDQSAWHALTPRSEIR